MKELWVAFVDRLRERFKKPTRAVLLSTLAKIALLLCAFVLLMAIGVLSVSTAVKSYSAEFITDAPDEKFDCIIVFGAKVRGDAPSDMLADRLETGVDLYHAGVAPKIIMSGDSEHDDYDEVSVMVQYAIDAGVPEENIISDRYGLSTYDSIWRAKNVFRMRRVVAVTQGYHLSRAVYIADKLGLDICGVPADLHTYRGQFMRDLREVVARFKDFYFVQLEVLPSYTE